MTSALTLPVPPDPVFTPHLHEYIVSLRPAEPHWYPNRGRDLTIMQLNITYRYDPEALDSGPWVFDRVIAYAEDSDGYTHQIRWTVKSKPERVPRWLPTLITTHTPTVRD